MKTKTLILALGCAVMLAATAGDADADLFGRSKSKRTDTDQKVWRCDDLPGMSFARGKLSRDVHVGWQVGGLTLQIAPDCVIKDAEGAADLYDGAPVMVMGPRAAGTIVAWRIEVLKPGELDRSDKPLTGSNIEWSEANGNVGEGSGPN